MEQTKFSKGDKVFAKIRGYPPWPARIEGAEIEKRNKIKYHVHFYGTAETGVVRAKNIWPYIRNKPKFMKKKESKDFSEAIIEIEEHMTLEELAALNAAQESGVNESVKKDDNIQKEKARKEDDKRRLSGGLNTQNGMSAAKCSPHLRKSTPPPPQPTVDDETCTKSKDKSEDYLYVSKDTINEIKIPLNSNKPIFINSQFAAKWNKLVLEYANSLKTMIEAGNFPVSALDNIDHYTKSLAAEFEKKQAEELNKFIYDEGSVLDTEMSIKTSLSIDSPNLVECIKHLDEMDTLPISALLFKKYPNIVLTIRKVRKYVGKPSTTPEEDENFKELARIVRCKADNLYKKFKSLFVVPTGQSFFSYFVEEVDAFGKKFENLTMDEVFTLMEE